MGDDLVSAGGEVDDRARTIDELLLDELGEADLPEGAQDMILAALLGQEQLDDALGGERPARPGPAVATAPAAERPGTYLTEIEVTGFRGVGPTATLRIEPGPGLTLVVGRNGSGKSTFAEAAEYALTGDNRRWSNRPSVWKDGWRNLHTSGDARIRLRLGIEGVPNGATVECHWPAEARLAECERSFQVHGAKRASISELGWETALDLYRPFLSYNELGGLISSGPSEIHDALERVLGLGRVKDIEKMLKDARKRMQDVQKVAATVLTALRPVLTDHDDLRARKAEELLAAKVVDLGAVEALLASDDTPDDVVTPRLRALDKLALPDRELISADAERLRSAQETIKSLAATNAAEAQALAQLLDAALEHHRSHAGQPCPVCGGRALDDAWAREARQRRDGLAAAAKDLAQAQKTAAETIAHLRRTVPPLPGVLTGDDIAGIQPLAPSRTAWAAWDALLSGDDAELGIASGAGVGPRAAKVAENAAAVYGELVAALGPLQAAARGELTRRARAWQPVAARLAEWIKAERASRQATTALGSLKPAIRWIADVSGKLRNRSLEPIAAQASQIWEELRQGSSVEISDLRLEGTGPARRLDIKVVVDDVEGAALGVMSQGELHSLGLALFLPRATMPASPFRFLVIDDPVQAMDPAKVYGLAEVLARIAKTRQVIVFTHDDRLPLAVRHLQIRGARVRTVQRGPRSAVTVGPASGGDPAERYLSEAAAVSRDQEIDLRLRRTVVGNLVREALESVSHDLIRSREHRRGTPVADVEETISALCGLRQTLALALLADAGRVSDVSSRLRSLCPQGDWVVTVANKSTHGDGDADPVVLADRARVLVDRLRKVRP